MFVKCPGCSKSNNLNFENDVSCGHCKKSLRGYTYGKVKKSVTAVAIALGVGSFSTMKVGEYTGITHRYSIKDEYAITEMCLNGSQRAFDPYQYIGKKEDCLCALGEVQKTHKMNEYRERPAQFLTAFASAARTCKASRPSRYYSE